MSEIERKPLLWVPDDESEDRITRLTGYPYRCNKCGEMDWGNGDRDQRHVKWRRKHWVECWGMSPEQENS